MNDDEKIKSLEKELTNLKEKRHKDLCDKVWGNVKHLSRDELSLLGRMIHAHFYGDGEDD